MELAIESILITGTVFRYFSQPVLFEVGGLNNHELCRVLVEALGSLFLRSEG